MGDVTPIGQAGPERAIGSLGLEDGRGVLYSLDAYPVRARPKVVGLVTYAFCRLEGAWPQPLFIGTTDRLAVRLKDHAALAPALGLGAVYLLVHRPDPEDAIDAEAAAKRLVEWHRPVLNGATANLAAWLPEPLDQQVAGGPVLAAPSA